MKKILTFCFFAFALLIGTQTAIAQNKLAINQKASNSAKELRTLLKFDEEALEKVYLAYQQYESKMVSITSANQTVEQINEDKKLVNLNLQKNIKNALGDELFSRYTNLLENKKF